MGFVGHGHVRSGGVRIGIYGDGRYAQRLQGLLYSHGDFAPIGYQYFREHTILKNLPNLAASYIRKTPRPPAGKGAFREAAIPSPIKVRVSAGSMMPSSHNLAVL
jgi:hypothetical protein